MTPMRSCGVEKLESCRRGRVFQIWYMWVHVRVGISDMLDESRLVKVQLGDREEFAGV